MDAYGRGVGMTSGTCMASGHNWSADEAGTTIFRILFPKENVRDKSKLLFKEWVPPKAPDVTESAPVTMDLSGFLGAASSAGGATVTGAGGMTATFKAVALDDAGNVIGAGKPAGGKTGGGATGGAGAASAAGAAAAKPTASGRGTAALAGAGADEEEKPNAFLASDKPRGRRRGGKRGDDDD